VVRSKHIEVDQREPGACWVTIDRAHTHNALARSVLAELADAVGTAGAASETRVVVLTGTGERFFAAGGDSLDFASVRDEPATREMTEQARRPLANLGVICTGLCARFPKLNFVSVESGAGWLLYMLESLDWHWKAYGGLRDHRDRELPSFYFRRQVFGSFWYENAAARAVAENLADNLMFETDFPHPTSLSPGPASPAGRPRDMVEAALTGLPDEVIGKILWKNAAKLYGVDMPTSFSTGASARTAPKLDARRSASEVDRS
jgi:predicted TIM-barrel fold metal-dependent hydrolase